MDSFNNLIKSLDFFSLKTHLTINDKGDIRYKNVLGGFLSLFYIITSSSFIIYFLFRLLSQNDISVMYSIEYDSFINISYSNQLPFMVRLSDYYRNALKTDKLYNISLKVWYNFLNKTLDDYTIDISDDIILEKCDINKHFGKYKKEFEHIKNLDSYYCPRDRLSNQTLFGVYGDNSNFSFYYFYFTKCLKSKDENCYDNEKINSILSHSYLDMIYLDYSVNNLNKKNPKKINIKSERFLISSSIYKRIWLYFREIKYITDNGLILTKNKEEKFHQVHSIRFDTDLRDIDNSEEPGTFLTLFIGNSGEVSVYNRKNVKCQDYLATFCGIVKTLSIIFELFNYNFSKNSYYIKIIKDFLIENNLEQKNTKKNINFEIPSSLNNSDLIVMKKTKMISSSNLKYKLNEKEIIEQKFKLKILPIKCMIRKKFDLEIIKKFIKIINNRLNIIEILNKLEIIEMYKRKNQNINSFLINNSNAFHSIYWKEKDERLTNANSSFNNKKINNFMSFEELKSNRQNNITKTMRPTSKFKKNE